MKIPLGIKKMIEVNALSFCTIGKNSKPHAIAVACCKVFGDKIIISNSHIKESIRNIKINNNVALVAWNKNWEKVSVGFEICGTAENQNKGEWFEFVKRLPENEGYDIKSAIVVKVNRIKKLLS